MAGCWIVDGPALKHKGASARTLKSHGKAVCKEFTEVPEDADDDAPECETAARAAREVVDEPGEEPGEQERGEDYPDDDDAEG